MTLYDGAVYETWNASAEVFLAAAGASAWRDGRRLADPPGDRENVRNSMNGEFPMAAKKGARKGGKKAAKKGAKKGGRKGAKKRR